jgi:hypothetical protein
MHYIDKHSDQSIPMLLALMLPKTANGLGFRRHCPELLLNFE